MKKARYQRSRWLAAAAAAGTLMTAACEVDLVGPPGEFQGEPIQTDALTYDAFSNGHQYSFKVVTTFRNMNERTVYLDRCFPDSPTPMYGVIKGDSIDEGSAYNGAWGCVGHDSQFVVRPGETRTDTLLISGPNATKDKVHYGATDGLHRIIFSASYCPNECLQFVPRSYTISNTFRVVTHGDIPTHEGPLN